MVNRPSMDLGQDEDFIFKHPYFFSNLTFKFEGLRPEIEKDLQNVIKSMDGVVSNESKHVFTDVFCLPLLDRNQTYYSITYLSDCMLAEDILEIEDYKLTNTSYPNLAESTTEGTNYCCENAKYTWQSKSCFSYFTEKVCCKPCIQKKGLPYHEPIETNNNRSIDQSNSKTIDSNVHNPNKKSQGVSVNTLNEGINGLPIQNSIERHSSGSVQHNFTVLNVGEDFLVHALAEEMNQEKEVINNISDSSDIEIIEEHTNIRKSSSLKQKSKDSKSAKQIKRRRMSSESTSESENSSTPIRLPSFKPRKSFSSPSKKIRNGSSSVPRIAYSSEESSRNEEIRANLDHQEPSCSKDDPVISKKNIKPSISRWVKKSHSQKPASVREKSPSNDEPNNSESEGGENQNFLVISKKRRNWWLHLPPPPSSSNNHHSESRRHFQRDEQQLMITYLVVKNLIHISNSRKPWSSLMEDGYLKYRTVESLNTHFRKTILPKIETFGLPEQIEKRFQHVRKMHTSMGQGK